MRIRLIVLIVLNCLIIYPSMKGQTINHFVGEWTWANSTDSIWIELKEDFRRPSDDPRDTFSIIIKGRYSLYNNDTLITGRYIKSMLGGLFVSGSTTQEILVSDTPKKHPAYTAWVRIISLDYENLKWELSERKYIGGVRVRFPSDPPFPKPIPGFKLPDNIVLTRLKD